MNFPLLHRSVITFPFSFSLFSFVLYPFCVFISAHVFKANSSMKNKQERIFFFYLHFPFLFLYNVVSKVHCRRTHTHPHSKEQINEQRVSSVIFGLPSSFSVNNCSVKKKKPRNENTHQWVNPHDVLIFFPNRRIAPVNKIPFLSLYLSLIRKLPCLLYTISDSSSSTFTCAFLLFWCLLILFLTLLDYNFLFFRLSFFSLWSVYVKLPSSFFYLSFSHAKAPCFRIRVVFNPDSYIVIFFLIFTFPRYNFPAYPQAMSRRAKISFVSRRACSFDLTFHFTCLVADSLSSSPSVVAAIENENFRFMMNGFQLSA